MPRRERAARHDHTGDQAGPKDHELPHAQEALGMRDVVGENPLWCAPDERERQREEGGAEHLDWRARMVDVVVDRAAKRRQRVQQVDRRGVGEGADGDLHQPRGNEPVGRDGQADERDYRRPDGSWRHGRERHRLPGPCQRVVHKPTWSYTVTCSSARSGRGCSAMADALRRSFHAAKAKPRSTSVVSCTLLVGPSGTWLRKTSSGYIITISQRR